MIRMRSVRSVPVFLQKALLLFSLTTTFFHSHHFDVTVMVTAFSQGAGHCDSGDLSTKIISGHGVSGGGPLTNGSLRVTFTADNNNNNSPLTIQTYATTYLSANTVYNVKLDFSTTNPNFFFRGLLFRLSGVGSTTDVEGTLSVGNDSNVKLKWFGCADGISAVTHANSLDKTLVEFDFEYTQSENADLLLEVTVVRERAWNNWFYSSYNLQIGDGNQPATSMPTAALTTTFPTTAPSAAPIASPPTALTTSPTSPSSSCHDSPLRFRVIKPTTGEKIFRDCLWVSNKSTNIRCSWDGIRSMCPVTCNACDMYSCVDGDNRFKVVWNGNKVARDCIWVGNKQTVMRCNADGVSDTCRGTCGVHTGTTCL